MKTKNYLLNFIFKSKYNFIASLVALLVLVFSVSTITYAWIEGATSLKVSTSNTRTGLASQAVQLTKTSNTNTISLSEYIDPSNLCLAPAKGELSADGKTVNVQFKEADDSFRAATTNDISTSYVFFELKFKCVDNITDLVFDNSSIKIDGSEAKSIKTSVTLLDKDRTALSSKIFSSSDISNNVNACEGLSAGEFIFQIKIWNDCTDSNYSTFNAGKKVNFNLNILPSSNTTTIYLLDYTNSSSAQNLLSNKTVKLNFGSGTVSGTLSGNKWTFEEVPSTALSEITFEAYTSTTATSPYATWTVTNAQKDSTHTVYGAPENSTITSGSVKQITLKDSSAENLLKADANILVNNGVDSNTYPMYCGTSTTDFTTYVPIESSNKDIAFSNGSYTANGAMTADNTVFYIFGETLETSDTKTVCAGKWYNNTNNVNTVTIQDRTANRIIQNNSNIIYATCNETEFNKYKALYDSANKVWKINYPNEYDSWSITSYETGSTPTIGTIATNTWDAGRRDPVTSFTYTLLTATGSPSVLSTGTWGEYSTSDIDPDILAESKISFYAGITNDWTYDNVIISDTDVKENITQQVSTKETDTPHTVKVTATGKDINGNAGDSRDYNVGKFTNLDSLQYYIKQNTGWAGRQIEKPAKAGEMYLLYGANEVDTIYYVDSVTAKTKVNNTGSDTKVTVNTGTAAVNISTELSQVKSLLGDDLSIEYFINDEFVKRIETVTSTDNIIESFDISAYTQDSGTLTLKTVVTDGTVYYVADKNTIKVISADSLRNVTLASVDNAVVTASYDGGSLAEGENAQILEGTELTVTTTVANAKFNGYKLSGYTVTGTNSQGANETINYPADTTVIPVPSLNNVVITADFSYDASDKYYIGGRNIKDFKVWSTSKLMTPDADGEQTNTLSATFVNSATEVHFKIAKGSFDNRDNPDYSVTLNGASINKAGDIVSAEISGSSTNTVAKVNAVVGTTIKVVYDRGSNIITVSGTAPTKQVTVESHSNAALKATYGSTTINAGETAAVKVGTALKITATPDENYQVTAFKVINTATQAVISETAATDNSATISVPTDADITIQATVKKLYSVKLNAVDNAVVTATYGTSTLAEGASAKITEGTGIELTAADITSGYEFTKFEICNSSGAVLATYTANPQTITLSGALDTDITINATVTKTTDRVIYYKTTNSTAPQIWYWYIDSNGTETKLAENDGYRWGTRPKMTKVDGTSHIYKYTLTGESINANRFIFYDSGEITLKDDDIAAGKFMYDTTVTPNAWVKYGSSETPTEPSNPPSGTKTINVYVISYIYDDLNISHDNYTLWHGTSGTTVGNASCIDTGTIKTYNVGYWSSAQTFHKFTAQIDSSSNEFKFHIGDNRWFGDSNADATTYNSVYIFNYSGDKATYVAE
ncbi:MAG: hypothetical protein ACI4I4_01320 [Acutalibacteraceae bacterium]